MIKRKHYLYLGYYMNLKMFYDKTQRMLGNLIAEMNLAK